MALTFEEFDQPAAQSGALTFEEFAPKPDNAGVLGNVLAGAVRGASNIGSTLLRPVDYILETMGLDKPINAGMEAIGLTPLTGEQRRQALTDFFSQYADPESLAFKGGELATEVAGTLGTGGALAQGVRRVAPALTKLPAALESFGATVGKPGATAAEKLSNAAIRTGAGAVTGGASAALVDPESAGVGAGIGAVLPAVGKLASLGAKGAGWLSDAVRGRLGAVQAGQIARDVAGPELAAIQAANQAAPGGITAAQAAAGVDRDTWQALAAMAERNDPESFYRMLADQQEAARLAALQGVTPDLAASQAVRTAADALNYPAAEAVMFKADPALAQIASNPYFKKAAASIANLAEAQGIDFKTNPTAYLNNIKFGFDKILGATGDTALSGAEKRVVYDLKSQLMNWMEKKNPLYAQARAEHAALSAPINQAQVLEEMGAVLQRPGGGERVAPFLNALGKGENALLKRADQSPRFGGIEDILTPEQLAVRDRIAGELTRDRTIAEQAAAGQGGLSNILRADSGLPRLPSYLSIVASTTNKAISKIEESISRGTMAALIEGMKSGASANQLLATVPAAERSKVAMWIAKGGPQKYLGPAAASQSAQ